MKKLELLTNVGQSLLVQRSREEGTSLLVTAMNSHVSHLPDNGHSIFVPLSREEARALAAAFAEEE